MAGNAEDEPVEIIVVHGVTGWFELGLYFYPDPWSRSRCGYVCGMAYGFSEKMNCLIS